MTLTPAPLLRGPRAHSITWMLDQDWLEGTVTCHATEGADCRLHCSEGCAEWDAADHEHELVDYGKCAFVEWMEASDGARDAHVGTHAPVDGFILPEWSGDSYTWTYVDD